MKKKIKEQIYQRRKKNRIGKEKNGNESKDANTTGDMLHSKIEEMIDYYLIKEEELQEVINEQRKDGYKEGTDITSNLYRLNNAVLIGQLVEAVDKIKAMKDEFKEMQENYQVQIK